MHSHKSRLLRFLAGGALLMLLLAAQAPTALAKSWSISRVVIEAALQPDGSLAVTEHRTFQFSGSFSHIYQEIVIPDRSAIGAIAVADEAGPYREGAGTDPGTYTVSIDGGNVLVDWYFLAADTEKTFTIAYTLTDAVRLYRDRAELNWDFIGARWEAGTAEAELRLMLPMEPAQVVLVEPDGALDVAGKQVQVNAGPLPAGQRLQVRVDLPRTAFPNAPLAPEAGPIDIAVQGGWIALATVLGVRFYFAHVKRERPDPSRVGPPQPLPPTLVSRFTGQNLSTGLRTLLADLSARGLVQVEQTMDGDWQFSRPPGQDGLQPYESKGLELFFGPGRAVTTLTEWSKRMEKDRQRYNALTAWWDELKEQLPDRWFLSWRWDLVLVVLTFVPVLLLTVFSPVSVIAIVAAVGLLILSFTQRRYSDEGDQQKAAWEAEGQRLLNGALGPAAGALALALGLKLASARHPADEDEDDEDAEVDDLPDGDWYWVDMADRIFLSTFGSFSSSDSNGGGDGGGDGGGGGGAE